MKNSNSMNNTVIRHPGIVTEITNEWIFVQIEVQSACAQCHAQGMCKSLSSGEKIIQLPAQDYPEVKVGQNVIVVMKEALGFQALILGYLIPAFVLIFSIFLAYYILRNELYASIIAIGAIIVYYLALSMHKNKLRKTFSFSLETENRTNFL